MSEAILLTGKRGEGKSLSSVAIMKRYLEKGRTVATNLDLNLDSFLPSWNKTPVYRLPDYPASTDLQLLPLGNPALYWEGSQIKMGKGFDEDKNGLLVLDEVAGFMNSRDWRDKDRLDLIRWLSQSRKYGWDLLLIAQHEKMVDSQIRNSLFELHGIAKRMDKIGIPVLSWFFMHFFGIKLRLPKLHVVTLRYGFGHNAPVSSTEMLGGSELYKAYDTTQKINATASEPGSPQLFGSAIATMLSPWYLKGRYQGKFQMYGKIASLMLFAGLVVGVLSGHFFWPQYQQVQPAAALPVATLAPDYDQSVFVQNVIRTDQGFTIILSDSSVKTGTDFKINMEGEFYKVGSKWYKKEVSL